MTIYNYSSDTKELISEELAELDPVENKPLIPANATTIKPLDKKDGFAICFDEKKQIWEYKKDLRGKAFWDINTRQKIEVSTLDFDSTGYTQIEPIGDFIKWDGDKWVEDLEAKAKSEEAKRANMSITMRQARLALLKANLLDKVEPTLKALPSPQNEIAMIEWEYASFIERTNPLILAMQKKFKLSDEEVDEMFIEGGKL